MKLLYYIIFFTISASVSGHVVTLENKNLEEIINARMKNMSTINKLSQKIYKQLNLDEPLILKENILQLKHAASDFQAQFPPNSEGGNAKNLIWENKKLFNEYNEKFSYDINLMLTSIEEMNAESLKKNFNNMTSNCGSCHKKFKNKK